MKQEAELCPNMQVTEGYKMFGGSQSDEESAALLLAVARIASKEIDDADGNKKENATDDTSSFSSAPTIPFLTLDGRAKSPSPSSSIQDLFPQAGIPMSPRIRTVSIDTPKQTVLFSQSDDRSEDSRSAASPSPSPDVQMFDAPSSEAAVISPLNSPVVNARAIKLVVSPKSPTLTSCNENSMDDTNKPDRPVSHRTRGFKPRQRVKTILRKKFSWKNYPEMEAFLIANREEYLRHSALNYTVQQKQYNNRLTERLIQLAADCGYVFDEEEFSFVTVRDRIRCYFKSYVQSAKKRGLIIGYAARRAGLLTDDELERSALTAGRIILPEDSGTASL